MMQKNRGLLIIFSSFVASLLIAIPLCLGTQRVEIKKGVAHGTFGLQGYSSPGAAGTLTFYNLGQMAEESSLSYVDDATISTDEKGYWDYVNLQGTFSGGPNGVATFTTAEGFTFNVPLKEGRVFELDQPGVWIHMTVSDPSIFDYGEEYVPEEYDPNVPLEDSGIRIKNRDGQLEIACPPDLEAWDVLKEGRVIYTHCHIKTGENSSVELSFPDMTTFKIRSETEVVIDAASSKDSKVSLLAGSFWANVKKMLKDGTMEVHGSQAVAGIKGTTFVMEETGEQTTLKVSEGTVSYSAKSTDETLDLSRGESVVATQTGFTDIIPFDVEAEEEEWESESGTNARIFLYSVIAFAIVTTLLALFASRKRRIP